MRGQYPLIVRLAPYSREGTFSLPPVESAPRIVWIGDGEPLEYPEIPNYVSALASAGREVFLHTNGVLLRRRVHEFQPSRQLNLVFRFDRPDPSANREALEAIRVAKLSGFQIVALTLLNGVGQLEALGKLHAQLRALHLDGYMVLPAEGSDEAIRALRKAYRHLLNRSWAQISAMFGALAVDAVGISPGRVIRVPSRPELSGGDCEEGAQA
jgi:MoaA/NifB/PqqE/SkfB family radical SAM enzyme